LKYLLSDSPYLVPFAGGVNNVHIRQVLGIIRMLDGLALLTTGFGWFYFAHHKFWILDFTLKFTHMSIIL